MKTSLHQNLQFSRRGLTRRSFVHTVSATAAATGLLSLQDMMSLQAAELRKRGKKMIVLWMQGGPSQLETFDPKSDSNISGPTKSIKTVIPGVEIAHAWPETAKALDNATIIRSMTSKEGNHQRATYQMHTGYLPSGSVKHPGLGSEPGDPLWKTPDFDLPSVVSIGRPASGLHAGHLGINYEPFIMSIDPVRCRRMSCKIGRIKPGTIAVADCSDESIPNLRSREPDRLWPITRSCTAKPHRWLSARIWRRSTLEEESQGLRDSYGDTDFGRGCLLARRSGRNRRSLCGGESSELGYPPGRV